MFQVKITTLPPFPKCCLEETGGEPKPAYTAPALLSVLGNHSASCEYFHFLLLCTWITSAFSSHFTLIVFQDPYHSGSYGAQPGSSFLTWPAIITLLIISCFSSACCFSLISTCARYIALAVEEAKALVVEFAFLGLGIPGSVIQGIFQTYF